jgi:hypothetical protein
VSHDEWAAYRLRLAEHREAELRIQAAARDRLAGVRRSG